MQTSSSEPTPAVYALGFSLRKQRLLRAFLDGQALHFVTQLHDVPEGSELLVWGSMDVPRSGRYARLRRVEDGFVRSVGLGAAFARPSSWVFDERGIHYDASRPSDLETILQTSEFQPALLARAAALRERIVGARVTKYNLAGRSWHRPAGQKRVCLVLGQVESDAALRFGAPGIRSNVELVRHVRASNPGAYLLYKPHPDVIGGLRDPGHAEYEAGQSCDEVVTDTDITELFDRIDEFHVMTSLAGFEALLRGKKVVTYGQPFYAGWGMTVDTFSIPRRTRRLTLDQLVAGALLLYPRYLSARTARLTTPEAALDEIIRSRQASGKVASIRNMLGALAGRVLRALPSPSASR